MAGTRLSKSQFVDAVAKASGLTRKEVSSALEQLPPLISEAFDAFRRCQGCDKVYWKGSHYERMAQLIQHVLDQNPADD